MVSRDMRLAGVIQSHYGKTPYVPVSYKILLRRALLITPLTKILFGKINLFARAPSDFGLRRWDEKLADKFARALSPVKSSCEVAGLVSGLRFRVPILDLNQINSPRAQPLCRSFRHFCE